MEKHADLFNRSCLVVAHPDDEILWFSSIITRVDKVIICFLGNPARPEKARARKRVLERYPLDHIRCLGIDVPNRGHAADWSNPRETESGLYIPRKGARRRYQASFEAVRARLTEELEGCTHVFTHNPWGEYGHDHHVQVYRAVQSLSTELGYQVWFPNYVSPRSAEIARRYAIGAYNAHISLPTNQSLAHQIRDLYLAESCWTAPDKFIWIEHECFNTLPCTGEARAVADRNIFPMSLLTWPRPRPRKPLLQRVKYTLKNLARRLWYALHKQRSQ